LLEPYGAIAGPDPQLFVEGYDGPIGRSATTALALVMNELATNAVKYGALKTSLGRVRLKISRIGEDLELLWREIGEHQVGAESAAEGFGSSLLHNAVERLLKGRLERHWLPGGLEVSIRVSLSRLHH
jgi:two-component sensor histidine kinase